MRRLQQNPGKQYSLQPTTESWLAPVLSHSSTFDNFNWCNRGLAVAGGEMIYGGRRRPDDAAKLVLWRRHAEMAPSRAVRWWRHMMGKRRFRFTLVLLLAVRRSQLPQRGSHDSWRATPQNTAGFQFIRWDTIIVHCGQLLISTCTKYISRSLKYRGSERQEKDGFVSFFRSWQDIYSIIATHCWSGCRAFNPY